VRVVLVVVAVGLAALAGALRPAAAVVRCGTISVPEYGSTKRSSTA
jgi:hypothetical protein